MNPFFMYPEKKEKRRRKNRRGRKKGGSWILFNALSEHQNGIERYTQQLNLETKKKGWKMKLKQVTKP